MAGAIEVSAGNLTVTVTFAPGTLSQSDTLIEVQLDTDENPQTGTAAAEDRDLIGPDYEIAAVDPRRSNQAAVIRILQPNQPGQFTRIATVDVTFPAADQSRITVPLALLGNDDGRLEFKVVCRQWLTDTRASGALDYMPGLGEPPGVVR